MEYRFAINTDEAPTSFLNDDGTYATWVQTELDEELLYAAYEDFQKLGYSKDDAVQLAKLIGVFGQAFGVDGELLKRRNGNE